MRPVTDLTRDVPWTASQRRALVVLLTIFIAVFGVRYLLQRATIDDPQPDRGARAAELADRLDPNTADWSELAAIPGLGEKKAHAIVDFRNEWLARHPNDRAFHGPQDLRQIRGIGPATVSNLSPMLVFPPEPAASVR